MTDNREQVAREQGFLDWNEISYLVARIDLQMPGRLEAFERWKIEDGSKAGLMHLLSPEQRYLHDAVFHQLVDTIVAAAKHFSISGRALEDAFSLASQILAERSEP